MAPSGGGQSLTVSYQWPGASPQSLERQVTARLEGVLSTLEGVQKISSVSGYRSGYILLNPDKSANVDALRLEAAALLRQIYRQLPQGGSYLNSRSIPPMSATAKSPCLLCN